MHPLLAKNSFIVYIDEAGDDGIRNFRTSGSGGTSPWLTIACCIVSPANELKLPMWRDEIISRFGPRKKKRDLHFTDLNHDQRVVACQHLATLPVRLAVVMSNKTNIPNHPRRDLFVVKNTLYSYLCRYLIERVSDYCRRRAEKSILESFPAKIIFSRRGGMNYDDFQTYLRTLKRKQLEEKSEEVTIHWDSIDIDAVEAMDHKNRAGLQLADIVASAFNQAVVPNFYGNVEPRYATLLADRMLITADGRYLGYGVKPVPRLDEMTLTKEQREIFNFYSRKRRAGP